MPVGFRCERDHNAGGLASLYPASGVRDNAIMDHAFVRREIGAGLSAALVAVPICISSGVLAYAPLGLGYIARGAVGKVALSPRPRRNRTTNRETNPPTNPVAITVHPVITSTNANLSIAATSMTINGAGFDALERHGGDALDHVAPARRQSSGNHSSRARRECRWV